MSEKSARAKIKDAAALVAEASDVRVLELQASLKKAHSEIGRLKRRHEYLATAMREAVRENMQLAQFAPVKAPKLRGPSTRDHVPVAFCSDWQLGKRTASFNMAVAEDRVKKYAEEIGRFTELMRSAFPVKKLHVWLLGDIVEGELIFPGQAHEIDASLYSQVFDGGRMVVDFLRTLLTTFETIEVVGVVGNHGSLGGRARKDMHPESNADLFLYRYVKDLFEQAGEKRIRFTIPDMNHQRPWCAVDVIGKYSCFLFHGDQIKNYATFPWYGFYKKVLGWHGVSHMLARVDNQTQLIPPFQDAAAGHFHQDTKIPISFLRCRVNGTLESDNVYALEGMSSMGEPSQHLMFVDPTKGRVTWEQEVFLG